MDESTGLPSDYSELFKSYFPMMCAVVGKSGIKTEDVEDVAMDILARFLEKDGISYYDPSSQGRSKFKGMLRGFTATYVMQYRDKQMIRYRREPWRLEAPDVAEGKVGTWGELRLIDEYFIDALEVSVTIISSLKKARQILETQSVGKRDYARFVDLCILHGMLDGNLNREAIREALGIGSSTLNVMLRDLRVTLRPLLEEAGTFSSVA